MELFLSLKVYFLTELFNIELFGYLAICQQNLYLYLAELELVE